MIQKWLSHVGFSASRIIPHISIVGFLLFLSSHDLMCVTSPHYTTHTLYTLSFTYTSLIAFHNTSLHIAVHTAQHCIALHSTSLALIWRDGIAFGHRNGVLVYFYWFCNSRMVVFYWFSNSFIGYSGSCVTFSVRGVPPESFLCAGAVDRPSPRCVTFLFCAQAWWFMKTTFFTNSFFCAGAGRNGPRFFHCFVFVRRRGRLCTCIFWKLFRSKMSKIR